MPAPDTNWPNYGNDAGGQRFSPLAQVNRDNVTQLKVAWTYRTGVLEQLGDLKKGATFEATPILVDGRLYLSTALDHVIALEPDTGKKIWEFDPKVSTSHRYSEITSRGVSAWKDSGAKPGAPCALRIFIGTIDARLIALDGVSGKPCADFGTDGQVDLTKDVNLRDRGDYQVTSAPAIAKDVVIT
ncbi:MAG: pyrroloquinoline quinone-dependent dehydrogenase, partial [Candidatus Acidiferrum sp.]